MTKKILDVSSWNDPNSIPYSDPEFQSEIEMVIAKMSMGGGYDPHCDGHLTLAQQNGYRIGGYAWLDPTQDWIKQAFYAVNKINLHKMDVWSPDVEQYWASWPKYWDYVNGKIPNSEVPRITSNKWVDCFCTIMETVLANTDVPKDNVMVYWADWVARIYPALIPFAGEYRQWIADYTKARSWIIRNHSSNFYVTWEVFQLLAEYLATQAPILPNGLTQYTVWQIDSKLIVPKAGQRLDFSIFPWDYWDDWLGDEPEPDPDPYPEDLVLQVAANHAAIGLCQDDIRDVTGTIGNLVTRLDPLENWAENISFKD